MGAAVFFCFVLSTYWGGRVAEEPAGLKSWGCDYGKAFSNLGFVHKGVTCKLPKSQPVEKQMPRFKVGALIKLAVRSPIATMAGWLTGPFAL